jgi:hypothetical protein
MITIKQLAPSDREGAQRWDDFIFACPEATFFPSCRLARHHCRCFPAPHLFSLRRNSQARFKAFYRWRTSKACSLAMPWLPCPSQFMAVLQQPTTKQSTRWKMKLKQLAQRLGVDHLEFRNVSPRNPSWPDARPLRHLSQGNPARR